MREADAMKGDVVSDEIKKVVVMEVLLDELRLYVRRRGLHNDRHSYEELRSFLVEHATIRDEEDVAKGSLRNFEEDSSEPGEQEPGSWMELSTGARAWIDAGELVAPSKGGNLKGKANGKGTSGQPIHSGFKGKGKGVCSQEHVIGVERRDPTKMFAKKRLRFPEKEDGGDMRHQRRQ